MRFGYSWLISVDIFNRLASAVRFITVIDVILVLLGLLGSFGLVLCQSDISCAVLTLRLSFFPDVIVIPWCD